MGDTFTIPWPNKKLHPNSRTDRRHTTDIRTKYKRDCWALCREAKPDHSLTHLSIVFRPPDGRRRDLDNMLGAIKYGLDGISQAMGVDDYIWSMSIRRGDKDPDKLGFVEITFCHDGVSIPLAGSIS